MPSVINRAVSSAAQTIQPLTHLIRRKLYPNIPADHTITAVSYGDREFKLQHRRWDSDKIVIDQCFAQSQYDLPIGAHGILMQNIYEEIVASGRKPLIFDCGANIGASTLWFSARYPAAHIVAIEPAPENFALLRINTATIDVDLRQAGIAATDGTAHLERDHYAMGHRTSNDGRGEPIATLSLATILASKPSDQYTPLLIKMDIEGAESSLFEGDTSAFDRFPLIVIEPHDWLFPGKLTSQSFFRFHAAAGREFCMRHENVASVACHASLLEMKNGLKN